MVRQFQAGTSALRYARVPVVIAPAGLTLGGGCEVALHGRRVQAAAETYMGLVEVGVGLIPAAGGTKELLARAVEELPPRAELLPHVQRVFETIGLAKVSTSAHDARGIGYLRDVDGVSMNRDRLMWDAKQHALDLVRDGYQPPVRRSTVRVGGDSVRAAQLTGRSVKAWLDDAVTTPLPVVRSPVHVASARRMAVIGHLPGDGIGFGRYRRIASRDRCR